MSIEKILKRIIQVGSAAILFAPILVNSRFLFPYIHLKNIYFRFLVSALLVLLVWYLLEKGGIWGRKNYIFYSLLALVAVYIVAGIFGVNPYNSWWGNYERMDGILNYIFLLTYFFILINVFDKKEEWYFLVRASLLAALLVSAYGFLQKAGVKADWIYFRGGRLDATIGNAAFLAGYLLLNLFLAAVLWSVDKVRLWRWFYVFSMAIYLVIIYFTATRGAMLGLVIGGLTVWLLWSLKKGGKQRAAFWLVVLLVLAGGWWLRSQHQSQWIKKYPPLQRLASISLQDTTTIDRLRTWQTSWQSFKDRPILGWGPENYRYGFNKYYDPRLHEPWFDRAHNVIFDYLNASGVLGLAAYLAIMVFAAVYGFYIWRRNALTGALLVGLLTAYLFQNLFVFDTLNTFLPLLVFLSWLSYQVLSIKSEGQENKYQWQLPGSLYAFRYVLVGGLVLLVIVFDYNVIVRPARANVLTIKAYASNRYPEKALNIFKQALDLNTFGSREISLQFSNFARDVIVSNRPLALKKEFFTASRDALLKILNKDPADIQARIALANLYQTYATIDPAYVDKMVELFDGHLQDSPRRIELYFTLAQGYLMKGDVERALGYLRQAYNITQDKHDVYLNLLNVYSQIGDTANFLSLVDEYQRRLRLAPAHYRKLAQFYTRLGLYQQAEEILQDKVINENSSWNDYQLLLYALTQVGKREQAIDLLNKLKLSHPDWQTKIESYLKDLENK